MTRVYWRPKAVSRSVVVLLGLFSMLGLAVVESLQKQVRQPHHAEKLAAAQLANQSMDALKQVRIQLGHEIDFQVDPAGSGMIGDLMTPVTTVAGSLPSKQTSINPNFAATIVDMIDRAGVRPGDTVAVGCSGSFPAMNVSLYTALETLKLKPIVISSASASQFGANFPDLLWIDMEKVLYDKRLISFRSVACSIGGYEDLGMGMTTEARDLVRTAIDRNALKRIEASNLSAAIDERMQIFRLHARGQPIKAYINVGGGTVSVGGSSGKKAFQPGLNVRPPREALMIDSVMCRFARQKAPVIHLVQIQDLAEKYELAVAPTTIPPVGEGNVFVKREHDRWLAGVILIVILLSLRALITTDFGIRLFKNRDGRKDRAHAEPMV